MGLVAFVDLRTLVSTKETGAKLRVERRVVTFVPLRFV
jgi:hypothetical protein